MYSASGDPRFGFRLFWYDLPVLAAACAGSWLLWPAAGLPAVLPALVVGHFFVFCNVVRMRRSYELAWAGVLCASALGWVVLGALPAAPALALPPLAAAGLIALEVRSPRYHGVAARRLNPALDALLTRSQSGAGGEP